MRLLFQDQVPVWPDLSRSSHESVLFVLLQYNRLLWKKRKTIFKLNLSFFKSQQSYGGEQIKLVPWVRSTLTLRITSFSAWFYRFFTFEFLIVLVFYCVFSSFDYYESQQSSQGRTSEWVSEHQINPTWVKVEGWAHVWVNSGCSLNRLMIHQFSGESSLVFPSKTLVFLEALISSIKNQYLALTDESQWLHHRKKNNIRNNNSSTESGQHL